MDSIRKVVQNGYCVGCGACSVASSGRIFLSRNDYGYYGANLAQANDSEIASASKVCPFSAEAENETPLGAALFACDLPAYDSRLGHYTGLYAGRIASDDNIKNASSGGLTSWVVAKLLAAGAIDGVVHVGENFDKTLGIFDYTISENQNQLYRRTKSRYYSVSFAEVISGIRGDGKKYAFIGVPCFVKAIRLLCRNDETLRNQIVYTVALVCGHMKSAAFAELLAWQTGISPAELASFDFRVKIPDLPANNYGIEALGKTGELHNSLARNLYGTNWGHAFFQLKACDFCDDVMGELADASFGDAWLPQYEMNWRGTNIVVCRNNFIKKLLLDGEKNGEIFLEPLSESAITESQAGNYRHRWDGLSVRLEDAKTKGLWIPPKRIKAGSRPVTLLRKMIIRLRQRLASESHRAFIEAKRRSDLGHFFKAMTPLTKRMSIFIKLGNMANWSIIGKKLFPRIFT